MTNFIKATGKKPDIDGRAVVAVLFRNDETSVGFVADWDWSWVDDDSGTEAGYEIVAYKVVV